MLLALLGCLVTVQAPYSMKALPTTTKPALVPPGFTKPVSVSEIVGKQGDVPIRVFRYSQRGDRFALKREFLRRGWVDSPVIDSVKHRYTSVERETTTPNKVPARQALLIQDGRWTVDPTAGPTRTRLRPEKGWVAISYNEQIPWRRPKPD